MRLRNIFQPVLKSILRPVFGVQTGVPLSANARTFELDAATTQLIIDPLSDEIVGRWITTDQTHRVGAYLYDFRILASTGRQVIAVPSGARGVGNGVSIRTGPDATEVSVPFTYTEATQAAPTLRASVESEDTFATASVAVAAYQGSVTPAVDAGRYRGAFYSLDVAEHDMTLWDVAGASPPPTPTLVGTVDGYTAYSCEYGVTDNQDQVKDVYFTDVAGTRVLSYVGVRAAESADVGNTILVYARASSAGTEGWTKITVPLTLDWRFYYVDKDFTGTASGNLGFGFRYESAQCTQGTGNPWYATRPFVMDMTGFTKIIAPRWTDSNAAVWSQYHPMSSMIDMSPHLTVVKTTGSVDGEAGLVVFPPVQRPIGTLDPDNRYHLAGAPHIGAYAGVDA